MLVKMDDFDFNYLYYLIIWFAEWKFDRDVNAVVLKSTFYLHRTFITKVIVLPALIKNKISKQMNTTNFFGNYDLFLDISRHLVVIF